MGECGEMECVDGDMIYNNLICTPFVIENAESTFCVSRKLIAFSEMLFKYHWTVMWL